jgi:hypothetical protein
MKKTFTKLWFRSKNLMLFMKKRFFIFLVSTIVMYSCKKPHDAMDISNISAYLIGNKFQLVSATSYNSFGLVTGIYKGTTADSLFFLWQPDSNYNVTATTIASYISGTNTGFGWTLKQIAPINTDSNFIVCSQPWKNDYSDTLIIIRYSPYKPFMIFKIGKSDNSFSDGYEIDSLKSIIKP